MLKWLFDFFSGLFNLEIPEPIKSFDPHLGEIEYRIGDSDDWVINRSIGSRDVDIHLEGPETRVDPRAVEHFLGIENRLPELWQDVIDFAIDYSGKYDFSPQITDFQLEEISVTPVTEFENGQICFWFTIEGDPDGTYFVPLKRERPIYVHRDT